VVDSIRKQIQKKMNGHCDQEYGYVVDSGQNIEILDNSISSTGSGVFFTVKFTVRSLKPAVGDEFEGKVFMIFEHGILIEVENLMKVFISKDKMGSYRYSKSKQLYKKGATTISMGDIITAVIEDIEYEKKNFNCIGSLKDK